MTDRLRIAVLGATGQVGWALCRSLSVLGQVQPVSRSGQSHTQCDFSQPQDTLRVLDELAPDVIVNAAAYTAVDRAESEREQAFLLNARLPESLAEWAAPRNVALVHYSTDYVFDGTKDSPYTEQDAPSPINVYGESKLAGDMALLESDADAWILRVSWVYGTRGNNFLQTMRRLMAERDQLRIVADQFGAPTWARSIADSTLALLSQVLRNESLRAESRGIYHLGTESFTSWLGFAKEIRDVLGLECQLEGIPTSEYPTPARRPANSRMNGDLVAQMFGIRLPEWDTQLRLCVD